MQNQERPSALSGFQAKLARDLQRAKRWERVRTILLAGISMVFAAAGAVAVLRGTGHWLAWLLLLFFGAGAVVLAVASFPNNFFERRATQLAAARMPSLEVNAKEVVCRYPSGEQRRIGWERLEQVSIVTNDRGPFADDVFWVLTDGETTIVITNDLPAIAALNERVCALPGARADQIVAAMGSTENATFAIWQREAR
jgi:hypothetical protein